MQPYAGDQYWTEISTSLIHFFEAPFHLTGFFLVHKLIVGKWPFPESYTCHNGHKATNNKRQKKACYWNLAGLDSVLKYNLTYLTDFWEAELSVTVKNQQTCLKAVWTEVMKWALVQSTEWLPPCCSLFPEEFSCWHSPCDMHSVASQTFLEFFYWIEIIRKHSEHFCFSQTGLRLGELMGDLICLHNGRLSIDEELADGEKNCNVNLGPA